MIPQPRFGPTQATLGQCGPNLGQLGWSNLAKSWPNSANAGKQLAEFSRRWSNNVRCFWPCWPDSAKIVRISTSVDRCCQIAAEFDPKCQTHVNFGRTWSKLAYCWPNSVTCWSTSTNVSRKLPNVDQNHPSLAKIWGASAQFGRVWADFQRWLCPGG